MSFFYSKRAGSRSKIAKTPTDHALVVIFRYVGAIDLQGLLAFEDEIERAVEGVGGLDGDDVVVDGSESFLYLYGPDANRLLSTVRPILERCTIITDVHVKLRYGPSTEGVPQRHVFIHSSAERALDSEPRRQVPAKARNRR